MSLGDVAARLLGYGLPAASSAAPILAKRSSTVRKLDDGKREEQEAHQIARAKKLLAMQGHLTLRDKKGQVSSIDATSAVLEKTLRKVATRGVVQLFNAVRTAQKDKPEEKKASGKRQRRGTAAGMDDVGHSAPLDLSRDSFLDILRRGSQPVPKLEGKPSKATFLQDDFMLGDNKAKHWGRALNSDEEEEEGGGGDMDLGDDDDEEEP